MIMIISKSLRISCQFLLYNTITNIAILENKDKGELFVSMPRYRSNERDESNGVIYKDVCNPITAEFREELYTNILDAYARIKEPENDVV